MSILGRDIKTLSDDDTKKYVDMHERAADSDEIETSNSGKAIYIASPKYDNGVWVPVSLCRREIDSTYGAKLMVPRWFMIKSGMDYAF